MSKSEILQELPKLKADERREIFDRICEMEEMALLNGGEPPAEEKALLDRELEVYRVNPMLVPHGRKPRLDSANRVRELTKFPLPY